MSYSDFSRRRKSSKYNIGDKVYIYDLATRQIMSGIVVNVPDELRILWCSTYVYTQGLILSD